MSDISKETKAQVKSKRDDLTKELDKLSEFINTDEYNDLNENDQKLLTDQHAAMTTYQDALGARIARFEDIEARDKK